MFSVISYPLIQKRRGNLRHSSPCLLPEPKSGYLFETTFQREATSDLTGERGSLNASDGV